jgi:hypothetical protein
VKVIKHPTGRTVETLLAWSAAVPLSLDLLERYRVWRGRIGDLEREYTREGSSGAERSRIVMEYMRLMAAGP